MDIGAFQGQGTTPGGEYRRRRGRLRHRPAQPPPGDQPGQRPIDGRHDHLRPGRVRRAPDDHPDRRPADPHGQGDDDDQRPGAYRLTVSGNGSGRVFDIQAGSAAISGLTITGGVADDGGGLRNAGGTLALTDCTVSGNSATGSGGGLYSGGRAHHRADRLHASPAIPPGTAPAWTPAAAPRRSSTSRSAATRPAVNGGGLRAEGADLILTNATVSGNSAPLAAASMSASPPTPP